MARRLSERTQAVVLAVALAVSIAALYGLVRSFQPSPVATQAVVGVGLAIDGDGWSVRYLDVDTTNNTAFGLLLEAADRFGFDVAWVTYDVPPGVFVTAINGTVNDSGDRWWQYWINSGYGRVAADRAEIVNGDVVTWRFAPSAEAGA